MKSELENLVLQMYRNGMTYREAVRTFQRAFLSKLLQENRGNQCKTARQLGVHRNSLSRIIAQLELDARPFRPGSRRPPESERQRALREKLSR